MAEYTSIGQLLANQQPQGNAGASALGAMFGGAGKMREQDAFGRGAIQGATIAEKMEQTRKLRQEFMQHEIEAAGRRAYADKQRKQGHSDIADMFEASMPGNFNEMAQGTAHLQHAGYEKQAVDLANAPNVDYNHLNALKMATSATPTELVHGLGDGSYTHNAYRTDSPVEMSDLGRAVIGEKGAIASKNYAEAGAANALRDQRNDARKGTTGKPVPLTSAAEKIFNSPVNDEAGAQRMDSQGRPVFRTDVDKMKDFQRFIGERSPTDPKLLNQNAALPKYLNEYGEQNDSQPPGSFTPQEVAAKLQTMGAPPDVAAKAAQTAAAQGPQKLGDMFGSPAHVGDSPHPEGTKLRGPDGKMYVVQNGQPVLVQ